MFWADVNVQLRLINSRLSPFLQNRKKKLKSNHVETKLYADTELCDGVWSWKNGIHFRWGKTNFYHGDTYHLIHGYHVINYLIKIMCDLNNIDTFTDQSLRCRPVAFYK